RGGREREGRGNSRAHLGQEWALTVLRETAGVNSAAPAMRLSGCAASARWDRVGPSPRVLRRGGRPCPCPTLTTWFPFATCWSSVRPPPRCSAGSARGG